jgi:3-oxoacyl-[acyl-carrier protein] reductase
MPDMFLMLGRINCVSPGLIATGMTQQLVEGGPTLEASEMMIPLGRVGEADEVARALEFLLHPASCYITGQVLGVDGGLMNLRPTWDKNHKPS